MCLSCACARLSGKVLSLLSAVVTLIHFGSSRPCFGFPPARPGGRRLPGMGADRSYRARSLLPLAAALVLFTVGRGLLSSLVVTWIASRVSRYVHRVVGARGTPPLRGLKHGCPSC